MANEKVFLKWTDFESNISVAFRELREEKDFFDVTLVCNEDQIQAHKVILSACSPFFRSLLKRNPHAHPLIYLKGVKLNNLQAVLDFIYSGEASVAQEELNSFLAVAEELKVKGLTGNQSSKKQASSSGAPPSEPAPPHLRNEHPPTRKLPPTSALLPKQGPLPLKKDLAQEFGSVKSEPSETPLVQQYQAVQAQPTTLQFSREDYGTEEQYEQYEDFGQFEGDSDNIQNGVEPNEGFDPSLVTCFEDLLLYAVRTESGYKCSCGVTAQRRRAMQEHIESRHFPNHFDWNCDICGVQSKTSLGLRVHKSKYH